MPIYQLEAVTPFDTTTCTLSNGDIVIAYRISTVTLKFAVYSSDGTEVVAPTAISGTGVSINCGALTGGGFVIAYDSGTTGSFEIYNNAGVLQYGPTVFDTPGGGTGFNAIVGLANGNFAIAYEAITAPPRYGYFVVYSNVGVQVVAPTMFSANIEVSYVRAAQLANGNLAIVYQDDGLNNDVAMAVHNSASGAQVVAPTIVSDSAGVVNIDGNPIALSNGNLIITYVQFNVAVFTPRMTIVSSTAVEVLAPFDLTAKDTSRAVSSETSAGNILVVFNDFSDDQVYYEVYDTSGNELLDETAAAGVTMIDELFVSSFSSALDLITFDQAAGDVLKISIEAYGNVFSPPADIVTNKRLIAFANNTLFQEDI